MRRENVHLRHAWPESSYWMFLLAGELYPLSKEAPTKRRAINHARQGISNGGQNLDQSKARLARCRALISVDKNIPDICQFWGTTALLSPVNRHQKVRKFATKQPELAKIGQNLAFYDIDYVQKRAPACKKFTTAAGGGGYKYEQRTRTAWTWTTPIIQSFIALAIQLRRGVRSYAQCGCTVLAKF